ncbi:hypothetical protein [Thalassobellus suaedae]|uniref:Lipoprotein n=1 Tax=Thalassobellus suaedae TaxID=3074124 RepID=A0ABY9Y728_9FLAO|nr:hypothetical protein RHP49_06455 [Flavobacteriaceae bacterium HL-DH10]
MKKIIVPLFSVCLLFMAFQCEDNNTITMEEEKESLNVSKKIIEDLANTSICNETTTCKFIAFGSKPCGGPWSYLTYSTSIDTDRLEGLVNEFNEKQADFNQKWNIASDCSFVTPPLSIECKNNTCIPVY